MDVEAELSSRKNLDVSSAGRSVYKLDPHYAEPAKTETKGLTRDRLLQIGGKIDRNSPSHASTHYVAPRRTVPG